MKKIVIFLSLIVAVTAANAQGAKIGYADAQKALETSKLGQKVKVDLEAYIQSRQKIVDAHESELKAIDTEIAQKASVLSPEAKKAKQEEFQKKMAEYQKNTGDLNREVQERKFQMLKDFNKNLETATQQVAEREGLDYVFDRSPESSGLIYAKAGYDVTAKVIEQLDRAVPKEAATAVSP